MKAIFISYNQALTDRVNRILDELGVRGFTRWALTEGRGTFDGEPHYGTHAWPSMNASVLAIVEDEKVAPCLGRIAADGCHYQDARFACVRLEHRANVVEIFVSSLP